MAKSTDKAKAPAKTEEKADAAPVGVSTFTLVKNHGLTLNGRASAFYEAGTELHGEIDKDLIHQMIRTGAEFNETPGAAVDETPKENKE